METQASTSSENTQETQEAHGANGAAGLGNRLKAQAAVVKAQLDAAEARARRTWQEVPGKVKGAVQQAFGKVRDGLDLPSRREVTDLAQRIEDLDRKLAAYEEKKAR